MSPIERGRVGEIMVVLHSGSVAHSRSRSAVPSTWHAKHWPQGTKLTVHPHHLAAVPLGRDWIANSVGANDAVGMYEFQLIEMPYF